MECYDFLDFMYYYYTYTYIITYLLHNILSVQFQCIRNKRHVTPNTTKTNGILESTVVHHGKRSSLLYVYYTSKTISLTCNLYVPL